MIIDLCCGLGLWPDKEVIRIDINPDVKPTIIADVQHLPLRANLNPKLVHASPPCTYISKARRWRYGYNPKGIAESLRLIASCYDAFAYLGAENCTLEQPAGIENILGTKIKFKYDKYDIRNATTNFYTNIKSQRRAMIPQWVRLELLKQIEP